MDKEVFIYSCNCFFDVCLLSYFKKENFKQLCNRVRDVSNKKFANVQEKMCSCSNCTSSFSYKLQGIWMLREYDFGFISKYIVCKNYLSYILRDIFICEYEEKKMNMICLEKRTFTRCVGTFPCCYNYFQSGLFDDDYEGVHINLPAHSLWGRHQNTFTLILLQVLSNNPSIRTPDVLLPLKFIRMPLCNLLMLNKQ